VNCRNHLQRTQKRASQGGRPRRSAWHRWAWTSWRSICPAHGIRGGCDSAWC
jgi:hypothetical protein